MISKEDFLAMFPGFTDEDWEKYVTDGIECYIGVYYGGYCGSVPCESDYTYGLIVAHLISLQKSIDLGGDPLTGFKTSKSVDGVSVSFANMQTYSSQDQFWQSTPYGKMFMQATAHCGLGAFFV